MRAKHNSRHKRLNRRLQFKSRTKLQAFHIVLILLQKAWIQLFSPSIELWRNAEFFTIFKTKYLDINQTLEMIE